MDFTTRQITERKQKKKSEKRAAYLDIVRELKKNKQTKNPEEHESDDYTSCHWCAWNNLQKSGKRAGRLGSRRISGDHLIYNITKIG